MSLIIENNNRHEHNGNGNGITIDQIVSKFMSTLKKLFLMDARDSAICGVACEKYILVCGSRRIRFALRQ